MNPMGQGGGRQGPLGMHLTPWVLRIMIATAVLSIVGALSVSWLGSRIPLALVFQPAALWGAGEILPGVPAIWQLVTYPFFVLSGPLVLVFAVLVYGWFAGTLEDWWGSRRFLLFFLLLSAGPALLTTALAPFWPALAAFTFVGPSPVLEGMIIAWGLTFRDRQILLMFVLPVKGIHLVVITVAWIVLAIIFAGTFVPFVPDLFGMLLGAVIVSGTWRPRKLTLLVRKWSIERQIRRERDARKKRVEEASHLSVAPDPDEDDDEGDAGPGPRAGKNADGEWLN
ncbi:MAG: rhomboid family intramembrane serine protease [Deltaproteobacteria bacterium]|nr:rhomboid family intramembrane serine protease [Deltaproteobacteria bacterium]